MPVRVPSLHTVFKLSSRSYAQAGEDMLARFGFGELGIRRPTYLDLGAHHPKWLSNTYHFYRRGSRGVCVEADPMLCRKLERRRPRDTCLNVAVGPTAGEAVLHLMSQSALNTTSAEAVADYQKSGQRQREGIRVPILPPATIVDVYCRGVPDLVSLDVERADLDVLRAWDFKRHRPA